MQTINIFRAGKHPATSGESVAFSEFDLAASVAAYDPAKHEAPLVVGHPKHDAPAYGWVKSLALSADGMEAEPQQLDPAFAEMVGAKRFKKISSSFYRPDSPNNPVPGVYYLRHVGFLGAMPPAVKGLRAVEFGEAEEGVVEFSDFGHEVGAGLWRRMREWLISQFGKDTADQVVPGWEVDSLTEVARTTPTPAAETTPSTGVAFSDPLPVTTHKETTTVDAKEAAALEAENKRLKAQIAQDQLNKRKQAQDATHKANMDFAEELIAKGMKPAHLTAVVAALDFAEDPDSPLEFGEGETRKPLAEGLRTVFAELAGHVNFSEQASKNRAGRTEEVNPLLADADARSKS
ncbi:TPA: peptidase [Citrobacter farmeri]